MLDDVEGGLDLPIPAIATGDSCDQRFGLDRLLPAVHRREWPGHRQDHPGHWRIAMTTIRAPRAVRVTVSDTAGFWGLAGLLGLLMFAAGAPSPLYGVYAERWHFSAITVTVVFAVYAIGLLAALLVVGRLSDHVGRRRVILAAVAVEMVSMLCFIAADSTTLLFVGRTLQGLATGSAIGALSAALVEVSAAAGRPAGIAAVVNSAAPTFGLAAGALGASALVQYGPAPTRLVYWLVLGGLVAGAVLVAVMRETGARRPGALASLVPRAGVPRQARASFGRALPCLIALWALGGFYLSLGPALAATLATSSNLLWGGTVIFLLTGTGAAAAILGRHSAERLAMLYGCTALFAGVAITLLAILTGTAAVFLAGSVVAGAGFGLAFLGAFRTLSGLAQPTERAGLIAVIYIVSYLAFSIPVVVAGAAVTGAGLHDVALGYAAVVAVLAALGAATSLRGPGPDPASQAPSHRPVMDLPPCPGTVPLCVHGEAAPGAAVLAGRS
jgi:MFS family permease